MLGLVIVAHGRLAEELRSVMEHVVGPQRDVVTINVGPDDDPELRRADVRRAIELVDSGEGVVLLTDMLGGTPSNLCIAQMARTSVEVIAGVNLPMLIKLAKVRGSLSLSEAVACAQAAGRKYIASAGDVLPDCRIARSVLDLAWRAIPRPSALARSLRPGPCSLDQQPSALDTQSVAKLL